MCHVFFRFVNYSHSLSIFPVEYFLVLNHCITTTLSKTETQMSATKSLHHFKTKCNVNINTSTQISFLFRRIESLRCTLTYAINAITKIATLKIQNHNILQMNHKNTVLDSISWLDLRIGRPVDRPRSPSLQDTRQHLQAHVGKSHRMEDLLPLVEYQD